MTSTRTQFTPETFRGNWQRRDSFVWWEQPEHAEEYGLWILSHRDSGLLDESNGAVIRMRMAKHMNNGDVFFFDCSHWAVGLTHEMAVRVYQNGTRKLTAAFNELTEIVEAIEQYPVLDETDYSDREYQSALMGIECMAVGEISLPGDVPKDWREQVYSWLSDHEPNELENTDDRGAYPSAEAIQRALVDLQILPAFNS